MITLPTLWFILLAFLWTGYLFLEGFDLGVGMLMKLLGRSEKDRRVMLNTIGPVWDGNEVWLITAGAMTFATFPLWYAALFSALYIPLVHIEFFNNLGQHALQQGQPGQARLAFERGVQYLRKQPEPVIYSAQLQQLEAQLARANSTVLTNSKPAEDEVNELTEGMKVVETDAEWKKKVIYD